MPQYPSIENGMYGMNDFGKSRMHGGGIYYSNYARPPTNALSGALGPGAVPYGQGASAEA